MTEVSEALARASDIHEAVSEDIKPFGGVLRCEMCYRVEPLGDVSASLATGWPKCCGYTMRWWTQRQIDYGEMRRG